MNTIEEIVAHVRANTDAFGPTVLGANTLARNMSPRRWAWVPTSETYEATEGSQGSIATRLVTVAIHSWGTDETEAQYMQAAVLTAIKAAVGARAKATTGQWIPREEGHRGAVFVTSVVIKLQVPKVALPLEPGAIVEPEITTAPIETIVVTPEEG